MKLREICHSRSGDKGDKVNISVICYDPADFPWLVENLTNDVVLRHFGRWVKGPASRYELPLIGALNFVIDGALDGGVTTALMIDGHGKGYSTIMLELDLDPGRLPPSMIGQAGAPAS